MRVRNWGRAALRWLIAMTAMTGIAMAQPHRIEGRVTQVSDGDSLWLTPATGAPVEVRLQGIDAPEGCQAGGPEARRALQALALQRQATLHSTGRDGHGRTLGTLMVGGVNVNQRLVEQGQAWSYRFKGDPGPYAQQERVAQARGLGLHAAAGAELPRDFRRRHGPCPMRESAAR